VRNSSARSVLRRTMSPRRTAFAGVVALALILFVSAPAHAGAHVGVFIGVPGWGYPAPYPYPYAYPPYPYYAPYAYYAPYPTYAGPYGAAPPGWVLGHWEWRYDPWGRSYPTWIPVHLR